MKRIIKVLIALIIVLNISACVKTSDDGNKIYMYPAFQMEENKKLWGYIDDKGKFVVEPKYDRTYDFSSEGLARVEKDGLIGVVDGQGEEILAPEYEMISDFMNGYFLAFDGKENQLFDYKGEIKFLGAEKYPYIGPYSDGMLTIATMDKDNKIKMGYMGKSGNIVIEPEYTKAYNFIDGKALVQENEEDNFKIIDKDNKLVKELDYKDIRYTSNIEIYMFKDENELYGLMDSNGNILSDSRFNSIVDVDNDNILVKESKGEKDIYGVVDKNGEYIIKPEYKDIILLGENYFALSKEVDKNGDNIYAVGNSKEEIITEAKYYNVGGEEGKIKNGFISVYDGENTYAIDLKGEKSEEVPAILGSGEVSFDGKVIKANISGRLSYYDNKGQLIWKEENIYTLREGARVKEESYLEGKIIDIRYPVIDGLENKEAEEKINERLYNEFRKTYDSKEEINADEYKSYKINYNVNRINDLLIIEQVIEVGKKENLDPIVLLNIYNINLSNGRFYELKDLFKEDIAYKDILTDIVRKMAEEENAQGTGMYDLSNWEGVSEDQNFMTQMFTIDIYFKPDEILSYSEQFPKFTIERENIDDILDYNSEFWWTFSVSKGF